MIGPEKQLIIYKDKYHWKFPNSTCIAHFYNLSSIKPHHLSKKFPNVQWDDNYLYLSPYLGLLIAIQRMAFPAQSQFCTSELPFEQALILEGLSKHQCSNSITQVLMTLCKCSTILLHFYHSDFHVWSCHILIPCGLCHHWGPKRKQNQIY